jgi:hypothetical protein
VPFVNGNRFRKRGESTWDKKKAKSGTCSPSGFLPFSENSSPLSFHLFAGHLGSAKHQLNGIQSKHYICFNNLDMYLIYAIMFCFGINKKGSRENEW